MISLSQRQLTLLCLLALAGGCTHPTASVPDPVAQRPVDAELLVNSLQCGEDIQESGVYWLSDASALENRYTWLNQANSENQLSAPSMDFATQRVLLVAMGQRPSSGYLLNLPDQPPMTDGRIMDVTVAWQEPEPGSIQAQVMVNPCLLIRLPALEIQTVRVLDRQGQVKITTVGG